MPTRRRRTFSTSAARRRTTWATVSEVITLAGTGDYQTIDLLANFKADGGVQQACTIARTHLVLAVEDAPDAGDQFAWGLLRGQNSDVGTNIAGAPTPNEDPYNDWVLWETLSAGVAPGGGAAYWPGSGNVWRYDIKAMRKLEELQMCYNAVFDNISGTAPLTIGVTGRVLVMLP